VRMQFMEPFRHGCMALLGIGIVYRPETVPAAIANPVTVSTTVGNRDKFQAIAVTATEKTSTTRESRFFEVFEVIVLFMIGDDERTAVEICVFASFEATLLLRVEANVDQNVIMRFSRWFLAW
jgi:hypothetical protein